MAVFNSTMNRKITALTVQKRNRQRVNVFLDGDFAFGLSRFVAAWLQVGQEISETKIEELKSEDSREAAYQQALKYLGYRPRSISEVRKNLERHNIDHQIIDTVIERLGSNSMLDDDHFAEMWVENRSEHRPRGRRALAYELRQRGIDPETIERSLEGLDEDELAYKAAAKQARKLKNKDWNQFRQKMYGFLSRRGFNYEISAPIVARVWTEQQDKINEY